VKDDRIEAIIDWEMSGYYPWWADSWLSLRWGDKESDELFRPMWLDLSPEMDKDAFSKQGFLTVAPVIRAWNMAREDIDHPGEGTELLRPGFCQCKPYAGRFTLLSLGQRYEHKLKEKNLPPTGIEEVWEEIWDDITSE
jgi:hypothetical protein